MCNRRSSLIADPVIAISARAGLDFLYGVSVGFMKKKIPAPMMPTMNAIQKAQFQNTPDVYQWYWASPGA
jgi:hypothetical protein